LGEVDRADGGKLERGIRERKGRDTLLQEAGEYGDTFGGEGLGKGSRKKGKKKRTGGLVKEAWQEKVG